MNKLIHGKKIILILVLSLFLTACSADSFIEIENKEAQYKEVEKQLNDLKDIKVKYIDSKRIEEMKDVVYQYYFRRRDDKKHGRIGYVMLKPFSLSTFSLKYAFASSYLSGFFFSFFNLLLISSFLL